MAKTHPITFRHSWLLLKLVQATAPHRGRGSAGFTILESLMGILVVTVLLISIAPVITLAVATRVQARRVEMATQASRTYLDAVKTGTVPTTNLPTLSSSYSTALGRTVPSSPTDSTIEACVDRRGNLTYRATATACASDSLFFLQAQGYNSVTTDASKGYLVSIRVYRNSACLSSTNCSLTRSAAGAADQNTFTGGTGVRLGRPNAPLLELTTEITASAAYDEYCKRLGGC